MPIRAFMMPIRVFTMRRSWRSRWADPRVHDRAKPAPIGRIVQVASEGRDTPEFLRRIAFMILSGNADAHVKNWSLTYPDGRRPRLAPAYDLVATIAYPGVGAGLALRLGEGDPLEITASDLVAFAETCGMDVDEASSVLREFVARARTEWDGVRSLAEMPEQVRNAVDGRLAATKL